MRDGNTATHKGVTYVAQQGYPNSCGGCAGKPPNGRVDTAFCNAMPNCMASDRRDKRDVVFVEKKGGPK